MCRVALFLTILGYIVWPAVWETTVFSFETTGCLNFAFAQEQGDETWGTDDQTGIVIGRDPESGDYLLEVRPKEQNQTSPYDFGQINIHPEIYLPGGSKDSSD